MPTSLGSPEFRGLTDPLPEVWRLHLKAALQTFRVKNVSLRAEGGYGRAKGTVRSKAEPWNERRVKNVSLEAKGDILRTRSPVSNWRNSFQIKLFPRERNVVVAD